MSKRTMLHITRLPKAARGGDREAAHRVAHRPERRRVPRDPALRADSGIRQVAAGALPSTALQTLRGSRIAVLCRLTGARLFRFHYLPRCKQVAHCVRLPLSKIGFRVEGLSTGLIY